MSDESGSDSDLPVFEPDDLATPDQSGKTLGDFHVLHRLGRGGMADVYLAEQASLGRRVALKILRPHLAKNQSYVRRFVNEARAAAALIHTNIVQVFDLGMHEGQPFLVMEYLEGGNLASRLAGRPIPPHVAAGLIETLARAVQAAHDERIVHRDLKPGNVMLVGSGAPGSPRAGASSVPQAKLLDFGLAKALVVDDDDAEGGADTVTDAGVVPGTVHSLAPEQLLKQPVDRR